MSCNKTTGRCKNCKCNKKEIDMEKTSNGFDVVVVLVLFFLITVLIAIL